MKYNGELVVDDNSNIYNCGPELDITQIQINILYHIIIN